METIRTDCLVVGSGLAGAAYALYAARAGLDVTLLSLGEPLVANSDWAQGGIIYDTAGAESLLAEDIMEASDFTANPPAVRQLVEGGPDAVHDLLIEELGVTFDRNSSGDLEFTREGGHSARRIIHAKDFTGHAILAAVQGKVKETPGIDWRSGSIAIDLLTLSHNAEKPEDRYAPLTCFGAYVLDRDSGVPYAVVAKKTVLATGGLGGIFRHSTNVPGAVGHGLAMAYRVGARLIDLEYVQFHPTIFFAKNAPRFLISEALRGEGAVLVNAAGEPFMEKVHARASLAPRDIVSRAIHHELAKSGEPCVYLDLGAIDKDYLLERFPAIRDRCREHGVDISRDSIPVVPAAHYSCGGIHTDLDGRSNILNLNAIGETACTGLHGANRLASTSLLECLTGARATARADADDIENGEFNRPRPRTWRSPSEEADPTLIYQDLNLMQRTMWNYAGIVRSPRRLTRARRILLELREEIQSFYRNCRITPELVELRNAVQTALLVVHAASLNPESKGAHYVVPE